MPVLSSPSDVSSSSSSMNTISSPLGPLSTTLPRKVRSYRSVLDYQTDDELINALQVMNIKTSASPSDESADHTSRSSPSTSNADTTSDRPSSSHLQDGVDWHISHAPALSTVTTSSSASSQLVVNGVPTSQLIDQEAQRLRTLQSYHILETPKEPLFEQLTSAAGELYDVPWACVSFVDLGRQWFKSMWLDDLGISETPRQHSFCAHAILQESINPTSTSSIMEVRDTLLDPRFQYNPYVLGGPQWRFYAGAPLVSPSNGVCLGTFCLLDQKPRPQGLSEDEKEMLVRYAQMTVARLEARRNGRTDDTTTSPVATTTGSEEVSPATLSLLPARQSASPPRSRPLYNTLAALQGLVQCQDITSVGEQTIGPPIKKSRSNSDLQHIVTASECVIDPPSTSTGTTSPTPAGAKESEAEVSIIPRPITQVILPDPRTKDVDPDRYLLQLIDAVFGVKVRVQPAGDLTDYFVPVHESQMAAYNLEIVSIARQNDLPQMKTYCQENGPQSVNCCNRFGEGLLNMACRRGFVDMVEFLVAPPVALPVRIRDDYGRTPMHDACWHPEPQSTICTWLMEREPALFLIADKRGYTPFQYARKCDWTLWRQFLFDRVHLLAGIATPSVLSKFT